MDAISNIISIDIYKALEKVVEYLLKHFGSKSPQLSKYFRLLGDIRDMDFLIYQLGLRPLIPIVDLLYFEYIKFLLKNNRNVKKVIVFPTPDLSWDEQDQGVYNTFKSNLLRIFKEKEIKDKLQIEFLPLFNDLKNGIYADCFFEKELLYIIKYTGSKRFIDYISKITKINIKSFCDFNKFHPPELRLVSIYVHLIRNLWIKRFLEKQNILSEKTKVNLGFLIWEWEIDKLGIYNYLANKYKGLRITSILGKTVFASRNKPIPVFTPHDTIYVFEDIVNTAKKIYHKQEKEVKNILKILKIILISNYPTEYQNLKSKLKGREINERHRGFILSFPELGDLHFSMAKRKCLFLLQFLNTEILK